MVLSCLNLFLLSSLNIKTVIFEHQNSHPELDSGSRRAKPPLAKKQFEGTALACQRETLNQVQGDVIGCSYRTVGSDSDNLVGADSSLLKVLDYVYIHLTLAIDVLHSPYYLGIFIFPGH